MSYDLVLATTQAPGAEIVAAWVELQSGVRAVREDPAGGPGWQIERRRLLGWRHVATLDVPVRAEPADLHELLRAGVRAPAWLTEIQLPYGASADDRALATDLATHLAKACAGAVFDPQLDALIWPTEPMRRVRAPREQRIRLVRLEWFVPLTRVGPDLPRALVELLRDSCPDALPRRYGSFEPPQERFEGPSATDRFAAFWEAEAAVEHGGSLFWTTTRPVLGGSVTFPDHRDRFRPPGAGRTVRLGLGFNGTFVEADDAWLDRTTGLFEALADRFEAAYAHGFVERNVILRRGIWYGPDSEIYPRGIGRWFVGLPDAPMWLAWYGPAYASLVRESIPSDQREDRGKKLLVRRGRDPMDRDALRDAPALPAELVVGSVGGAQRPAQVIPDLD